MVHTEGFDGKVTGDLEKFIERVKEIWQSDKSKRKGASIRYGLTIGVRNNMAMFEPTVTTGRGVMILIMWNLDTEAIKKIKGEAHEIELNVKESPYLWSEIPAVLPTEKPF